MFQHIQTFTDYILEEERKVKNATGSLTLLLTQIENAAKIIASHVKKTGLVDILGSTGKKNVYEEDVQKLDEFCDALLQKTLLASGQVFAVASEELPDFVFAPKHLSGHYQVFFDPLDGSSNIDTNSPIGTIFSIYKKGGNPLSQGSKQVAAGYILYGASIMFVISLGKGVYGFTLDPSIGSFLLSHPDIKIPKKGSIYSVNEANFEKFPQSIKNYLSHMKKNGSYKARYNGTMVSDIHRVLLKGGIFLYPEDSKNKEGKLRLLFEVNPMSFLIFQAGGLSISRDQNPLDIIPSSVSQRVPIAIGSEDNVKEYLKFYKENLK